MPINKDNFVNSGVQNIIGTGFQKHCTLFLFLEKFEDLRNTRYFIILEHLEDIVFGYLDENDCLIKIETFQAKKSTNKWILSDLIEIIKKITETSQAIINDSHSKTLDFYQQNYFATNNTIELKVKHEKVIYSEIVNENKCITRYIDIDQKIKNKIKEGNINITFSETNKTNLDTLHFKFIDLSRSTKAQYEQLQGKFITVFGNNILDHKAAMDTFLFRLNEIESVLNQGNVATLTDRSKRIESNEIENILNILTTKKKAFDFWRQQGTSICQNLRISIMDRDIFKLHYMNSFDKFKDLTESEHLKVFQFVQENTDILRNNFTDTDCITALYKEFNKKKSTTFNKIQLKAVISAAYLEGNNSL